MAAVARAWPRRRALQGVALGVLVLTFALTSLAWILLALSFAAPVDLLWGVRGSSGLFAIAFGWIGYLVATRQPRNPIGWAFLAAGGLSAIQVFTEEYAAYALVAQATRLPGDAVAAWVNDWVWMPALALQTFPVFLYFPDGRLPSPKWRPVLVAGMVGAIVTTLALMIAPAPILTFGVPNPFGVANALTTTYLGSSGPRQTSVLAYGGLLLFGGASAAGVLSSVRRFRTARDDQRQQLKWFAGAAVAVAIGLLVSFVNAARWAQIVLILAIPTVPIAVGIAILRYRLYEIDTLINRAVVYGMLTALLAGLYAAAIGAFQRVFIVTTGERSDAAIVITTLILAAVFTPARNWLQSAADRRFKAPIDAHKRLESFRESVRLVSEAFDAAALRRRFLDEVAAALDARGARFVSVRSHSRRDETVGEWPVPATAWCDVASDGVPVGRIELGPRRDGVAYTDVQLRELGETASVVARAFVIAERLALGRSPGG